VNWLLGTGHHRRYRKPPGPEPGEVSILSEPASGDLTIDELREFLDNVDRAAAAAGVHPGGLRPSVAVRFSGAVKGIWVRIPARRQ
jgi:hypothetical protein